MARSAREMVQLAFTLTDGGARGSAGVAKDAANEGGLVHASAKSIVASALKESGEGDVSDDGAKSGKIAFREERIADGKVRLSCLLNFDKSEDESSSAEDAAMTGVDENGDALTPVTDALPGETIGIAEDGVKKSNVKTTAANCKAENVLKCPYHGPEQMEKSPLDFFKKKGIVNVDAAVEPSGKGKYLLWAVCEEDDTENLKQVLSEFVKNAGVQVDGKGVHYDPADEQTIATFKADWLDKNAKSSPEMHHQPDTPAQNQEAQNDKTEQNGAKSAAKNENDNTDDPQGETGYNAFGTLVKDAYNIAFYATSGKGSESDYDNLAGLLDTINGSPYVQHAVKAGGKPFSDIGMVALSNKLNDLSQAHFHEQIDEVKCLKDDIREYVEDSLHGKTYSADDPSHADYWDAIEGMSKHIKDLTAVRLNGRIFQFDKMDEATRGKVLKSLQQAVSYSKLGDMGSANMVMKGVEKMLMPVRAVPNGSATYAVATAEANTGKLNDRSIELCKNAKQLNPDTIKKYIGDVKSAYKIPGTMAEKILNGIFDKMKPEDFTVDGEGKVVLTPLAYSHLSKAASVAGEQASAAMHENGIYPISVNADSLSKVTEAYNAMKEIAEGAKGFGKIALSTLNAALGTPYQTINVDIGDALTISECLYDATELIGSGAYTSASHKLHLAQKVLHGIFLKQHGKSPVQQDAKPDMDLSGEAAMKSAIAGLPYSDKTTWDHSYSDNKTARLAFSDWHDGISPGKMAAALATSINEKFGNVTASVIHDASSPTGGTSLVFISEKGMTPSEFAASNPAGIGLTSYDSIESPTYCGLPIVVQQMVASVTGNHDAGFTIHSKHTNSFVESLIIGEEINRLMSGCKVSIVGGPDDGGYSVKVNAIAPNLSGAGASHQSGIGDANKLNFKKPDAIKASDETGKIDYVAAGNGASAEAGVSFVYLKAGSEHSPYNAKLVAKSINEKYDNVHAASQHLLDQQDKPTGTLYVKVVPKSSCLTHHTSDSVLKLSEQFKGKVQGSTYYPTTDTLQIKMDSMSSATLLADALNSSYMNLNAHASEYEGGTVSVATHGDEKLSNVHTFHFALHGDSGDASPQTVKNYKPDIGTKSSAPHSESAAKKGEPKFGGGKAFLESSVEKYKSSDPSLSEKFAKVLSKLYA